MITIQIENGPTFQVNWNADMNVQQAIEAAYNNATSKTFTYSIQYFGTNLGYLVIMINETYETFNSKDAPFFFWEFLLNGKISPTGIDGTLLNDNDVITFEFTAYTSSIPAESTVHSKYRLKINA